jgi:hypothetical protein
MTISKINRSIGPMAALLSAFCIGAASFGAIADDGSTPTPDGHAPAGVMNDHMHKAGEFMVGYRYSYMRNSGNTLNGTNKVGDHAIVHNACGHGDCTMTGSRMDMHMHMLDIMYAPADWLTLMVMPMWMSHDMAMRPLEGAMGHGHGHGGHMGPHSHGNDGIGDTVFGALVKLQEQQGHKMHVGLMLSAPTGSVDARNADGTFTHYHMQVGSGTWDFLPSFTYTGRAGYWSWGGQLGGVMRLEDENASGYRLGDIFYATAWGSYRLNSWLSASVRLLHTRQGEIEGHYNGPHNHSSPPDLQGNYGGRFWDVGVGLNAVVPSGTLKGHRLSVEWLEPISQDVNGYQLEKAGTLFVNWSKAF